MSSHRQGERGSGMCILLVAILFLFFAFLRIEPLGERATGVLLALLSDAILQEGSGCMLGCCQ